MDCGVPSLLIWADRIRRPLQLGSAGSVVRVALRPALCTETAAAAAAATERVGYLEEKEAHAESSRMRCQYAMPRRASFEQTCSVFSPTAAESMRYQMCATKLPAQLHGE